MTGLTLKSAGDTVERFQGGERTAILESATESDHDYLLAASGFLYDPRRLTVAISRAKEKMILVVQGQSSSYSAPTKKLSPTSSSGRPVAPHLHGEVVGRGKRTITRRSVGHAKVE